jgi:hypothetical protein
MGFAISWVAIKGKSKDDVLATVELTDTAEQDEANESPISGAELGSGWYVLFLNTYGHKLVEPKSLERLSTGCEVLACMVEEHVMASSAEMYKDGQTVWHVAHQGDGEDIYDLTVAGALPASFQKIRQRLTDAQEHEGRKPPEVDYIFDIPLELAAEICGYKHDQLNDDLPAPGFTKLVAAKGATQTKSIWPWRR